MNNTKQEKKASKSLAARSSVDTGEVVLSEDEEEEEGSSVGMMTADVGMLHHLHVFISLTFFRTQSRFFFSFYVYLDTSLRTKFHESNVPHSSHLYH